MKQLTRIEVSEQEQSAIEAAVAVIGDVLARFEQANKETCTHRPTITITLKREPDYDAEYPWPMKTHAWWLLDLTTVGHSSAPHFSEALDGLFDLTEATKKRETAALYKREAEKLEREAEKLERGEDDEGADQDATDEKEAEHA